MEQIVRIMLNLFINSLVPAKFSASGTLLDLPEIPIQSPSQVINRTERPSESGLFQSFTSYLTSYAADDPPEPSDEELSDTLCTFDCISACPFDAISASLL